MKPLRKGELVDGGVIEAVGGLRVVWYWRRALPGDLVVVEGRGRDVGACVDALDVRLFGLGARLGLGLGRRLGVDDERHGPAQVAEQLAQDLSRLKLKLLI